MTSLWSEKSSRSATPDSANPPRSLGAGKAASKNLSLTIKPLTKTDLVLLCPNLGRGQENLINPDDPTSDSILEGHVVLNLPSTSLVEKLQIEFVGKQTVYCDGRADTYETIHSTLVMDDEQLKQKLCPGEHFFSFSFVIPSNMAPSEDCLFGRTYYRLKASAFGLKSFGRALTTEHDVALVSNPSPIGSVAPGFHLETQFDHEVMGPVGITLTSQSLIVAGFLSLSVIMPATLEPVRLESIRVDLWQHFDLKSLKDENQKEISKSTALPLWSTKRSLGPIGTYKVGDTFTLSRRLRLNPDNVIRPSTAKWSKTGIKVTHELVIKLAYIPLEDNPTGKTEYLQVSDPAIISSCCCMLEELQLPAYSAEPGPASQVIDRSSIAYCTRCLCKLLEGRDFRPEDYGISEEEVKHALQWKDGQQTCWKEDVDFERDLCDRNDPDGHPQEEESMQATECSPSTS